MRPIPSVFWNLFLAVIPVVLAFIIADGARREMRTAGHVRWGFWLPLLLIWLVFLPNSCYLLTEWRHYVETLTRSPLYAAAHRDQEEKIDFFLVTGFYLFYSGAGLLAFFLALWPLDRLTRRRLGRGGGVLRAAVFPLCALGVYLGLMRGRFNSWDLVNARRLQAVVQTTTDVVHRPLLAALILAFGASLWLLYAAFDIFMDGAAQRLHLYRLRHSEKVHHASQ